MARAGALNNPAEPPFQNALNQCRIRFRTLFIPMTSAALRLTRPTDYAKA